MTFWPLTNSDFRTNQTFHQFHDLDTDFDLHRIMSGFHGAFAVAVACQQGTLTLPDTWFRPPILVLACAPIVETRFLELAMSLLDFSPRIPLGTFSILPRSGTIVFYSPVCPLSFPYFSPTWLNVYQWTFTFSFSVSNYKSGSTLGSVAEFLGVMTV